MLKRRILYFICLAVVFGVNIFYVEYQIFILLVLMIAIPLVSWIMYAISDVSLGLSLQVNKNVVQVGNRIKIRIVKKNACNLAFVNGSITIKYMYCHTGDEFMINVPIKQGIRKSAGITDISADYCGNICVGVESIEICDYLGLFGKKKQFAGVTKVSVMPEETTDRYMETDRANAYYDEENEVYVKSASDEVSELREYRDGDSPTYIHNHFNGRFQTGIIIERNSYNICFSHIPHYILSSQSSLCTCQPLRHHLSIYSAHS